MVDHTWYTFLETAQESLQIEADSTKCPRRRSLTFITIRFQNIGFYNVGNSLPSCQNFWGVPRLPSPSFSAKAEKMNIFSKIVLPPIKYPMGIKIEISKMKYSSISLNGDSLLQIYYDDFHSGPNTAHVREVPTHLVFLQLPLENLPNKDRDVRLVKHWHRNRQLESYWPQLHSCKARRTEILISRSTILKENNTNFR